MPKGDAKEGYLNTNAHLEAKVAMLMAQLAESQARELRLREAMQLCLGVLEEDGRDATVWFARFAMETTSDDAALREMIEAEREACIEDVRTVGGSFAVQCEDLIRARGDKP